MSLTYNKFNLEFPFKIVKMAAQPILRIKILSFLTYLCNTFPIAFNWMKHKMDASAFSVVYMIVKLDFFCFLYGN